MLKYGSLLLLIIVALSSSFAHAKTYPIKSFELVGFYDDPGHHIYVKDINRRLQSGLAKYKFRLSMNQMHYFAEYLTTWYKNSGLLFHKVIVPPQEIKDQRLRLKLIPGILGDISVRGNEFYSKDRIQQSFSALLNKQVEKEKIEEALLILNDSPGLDVFSFFSRGKEKNETRVNLKVQEEEFFTASVKLDNYGVESTGRNRLLSQFSFNNISGRADQFNLGILASDESVYSSLVYRVPMWNPFHSIGISVSDNQFDLAGDFLALGVNGSTQVTRIDVSHVLFRGYQRNRKLSWYFDQKESVLDDSAGFSLLSKEEQSSGAGINFLLDQKNAVSQFQFYLNIYTGQYDQGFAALDDEDFSLSNIVLNYAVNIASRDAYLYSRLGLMLRAQVSDDVLPSYEKFALTGVDAVRAVESGVISTDNAQLLRLNWYWLNPDWLGNNAFSKKVRMSVFYDWVEGEDSQSTIIESASGYGIAFDFSVSKNFSGRLVYAQSQELELSTFTEEESSHAYAELSYRF